MYNINTMPGLLDFIYDSPIFIDLYEILEIDMDAKSDEIKMSYIKLAKKNHPDQGGLSEKFQEITRAYEILYNKETRKEYDLYYLKKNMDEFHGDDMIRLRDEFKNFMNANSKPITKEELDKLYEETFVEYRDNFTNNVINQEEFSNRLNDIEIERKNMQIETSDDTLTNFIKEHNDNVDVNGLFEYLKYKNTNCFNNSIIEKEWGTLDTMPGYGEGYSSFISDDEFFDSNLYTNLSNMNNSMSKESINNLSIEEFINWKNTRPEVKKLTESDVNMYFQKREIEQNDLFKLVENDLSNKSKRNEISKFLKTKHINEDVNKYYDDLNKQDELNPTTKQNVLQTLKKSNVPEIIDLENPNEFVKKESSLYETSNDLDGMFKYMENVKSEKSENLDELEKELIIENKKYNENTEKGSFQELKSGRESVKINNVRKREFK